MRCDSSSKIGNGHIIRCRSLARELKKINMNPIFICRELNGNSIHLLNREFKVIKLLNKDKFFKENEKIDYSNWIGCSQDFDAKETLIRLEQNKIYTASHIIIDHYALDIKWEKIIKEENEFNSFFDKNDLKIVVIDDLFNRKHICDILIDQTFTSFKPIDKYQDLTPQNCIRLLGPSYSMIDATYKKFSKTIHERRSLNRFVIYFGANDIDNYTLKTLRVLYKKYSFCFLDVVIKKNHVTYTQINEIAKSNQNIKLHSELDSLASLFSKADLAIGAGGSSTWERILLGLPSIVIPIAKNQKYLCSRLEKIGVILVKKKEDDLQQWIYQSINSIEKSFKNIENLCQFLIDEFGTRRICNLLSNEKIRISLRCIKSQDKSILFKLANDIDVRENSFNKKEISIEEHKKWFEKSFNSKDSIIYLAFCQHNSPIGQIRFDIKDKLAILDFSIEKSVRGKGLGYILVIEGIKKILKENKNFNIIEANVVKSNIASIGIFRRIGFSEDLSKLNNTIRFTKNIFI